MQEPLRSLVRGVLVPILVGAAVLSLGAVVFGFFHPQARQLMTEQAGPVPLIVVELAINGAIAGAVIGLFVALGWALDDGERARPLAARRKGTRRASKDRARSMLTSS
jgi:amino acid transporter